MVSLHLGMCVCAFADKERMSMYRYFCLSVLQGDLCIAANSIQFQHFLALHQHSLPFNLLLPFIGRRCSHDYFWFQHLRGFVFMHHCIEEFSICVMERTHSCIHTAHADACVLRVNHFTIETRFFCWFASLLLRTHSDLFQSQWLHHTHKIANLFACRWDAHTESLYALSATTL